MNGMEYGLEHGMEWWNGMTLLSFGTNKCSDICQSKIKLVRHLPNDLTLVYCSIAFLAQTLGVNARRLTCTPC